MSATEQSLGVRSVNLLFVIVPICILIDLGLWMNMFSRCIGGTSDFRHLYVAGYMVRNGMAKLLYDVPTEARLQRNLVSETTSVVPFVRPPYAALLFVPLSWFSYRTAYLVWISANVSFAACAFWLARVRVPGTILGFAFLPTCIALLNGQDSILLLLLLSVSGELLSRKREVWAGWCVALGLFKFPLALPVALCFFLWRRWNFLVGFVSGAILVSALSIALVGWGGCASFARSIIVHSMSPQTARVYFQTQATFHGLWFALLGHSRLMLIITGISSALALYLAARSGVPREEALLCSIPIAVLVSYYANVHDWTILLLPMFACLRSKSWRAITAVTMFSAPALAALSWSHAYLVTAPIAALAAAFLWARSGVLPRDTAASPAGLVQCERLVGSPDPL